MRLCSAFSSRLSSFAFLGVLFAATFGLHAETLSVQKPAQTSNPGPEHSTSKPLAAALPRAAATETVVYSFPSGYCCGASGPWSQLIQAPDGNLWGTSLYGGANDYGEIFRITPAGVFTDMHDFNLSDGAYPYGSLMVGHDGNLYGTTEAGPINYGTLYEITTAGVFTTLVNQTNTGQFNAGLIQDAAGNFYTTTYEGGGLSFGQIVEYSPANGITTLYGCFGYDCGGNLGNLVQGSDGAFYGTASNAGPFGGNQYGTLFKVTEDGDLTVLYTFVGTGPNGGDDGYYPTGGLVELADGSLWGHAQGKDLDNGNLFALEPDGSGGYTYAVKHPFCEVAGCADGAGPYEGTLTLGGDGNLYGSLSLYGGGEGSVYSLNPTVANSPATTLYGFTGAPDAANPYADVMEAADGTLWGGTVNGGTGTGCEGGCGAIYKITPATPIPPSIVLTSNLASIQVGQSATLTYSVNNAYSLTAKACYGYTNGLTNGAFTGALPTSGTFTFTPTATGTYLFAYTCGGVQTATTTVTVTAAGSGPGSEASKTALAAKPVSPTVGQPVTLKATVSGTGPTPTGTVSFVGDGVTLGSATLVDGVATLNVSSNGLQPNTYYLNAAYSGDSKYASSASATDYLQLAQAPTRAALAAAVSNGSVTLTAAVTRTATGAVGTPTGPVTFFYLGTPLGTANLNASGVATLTINTAQVPQGSYPITAKYYSDASDLASTAPSITVVIK